MSTETKEFTYRDGAKVLAARTEAVGRIGSGKKTHRFESWECVETGRVVTAYSWCGSSKFTAGGRSSLRVIGKDAPVTCVKCNPDAPKIEAPAPAPVAVEPARERLTDAQERKRYALARLADLRERVEWLKDDDRLEPYLLEQSRKELAKLEAKVARMRVKLPEEK